jgi:uncharacterized protein YbjT (DUF2867 family)
MERKFKNDKIILVTGATGRQGGAVTLKLVTEGWPVRAFVRDPDKPASRTLAWKGVELVKGDLNDRSSIDQAMKGVYGVFGVVAWREAGIESEVRQGKNLADAAKAAGVRHFIYSSVGGADRSTGIPHFDSKWKIEEHIRGIGLPATIFRPAFMMYNFNTPDMHASIDKGSFTMALKPDRALQMLSAEDLTVFVNLTFENPAGYLGKAIELAGDELTMPQAAEIFSRVLGRPVRFIEQSIEKVRSASREAALMMEWFNLHGYRADIRALRTLHPGLMTLETWLRKTAGWTKAA